MGHKREQDIGKGLAWRERAAQGMRGLIAIDTDIPFLIEPIYCGGKHRNGMGYRVLFECGEVLMELRKTCSTGGVTSMSHRAFRLPSNIPNTMDGVQQFFRDRWCVVLHYNHPDKLSHYLPIPLWKYTRDVEFEYPPSGEKNRLIMRGNRYPTLENMRPVGGRAGLLQEFNMPSFGRWILETAKKKGED